MTDSDNLTQIIELFHSYRAKVKSLLSDCYILGKDSVFEIVPLQIAIAQYVYSALGADARPLQTSIDEWARGFADDDRLEALLKKRVDFYGEIMRGRKLRGEWVFGVLDDLDDNPILRCLVAFGDILINPACGDDYDNAPPKRNDIVPVIAFARDTMSQIISAYDDFCDQLADLNHPAPDQQMKLIDHIRYALQFRSDRGMNDYLAGVWEEANEHDSKIIRQIMRKSGRAGRALAEQTITELLADKAGGDTRPEAEAEKPASPKKTWAANGAIPAPAPPVPRLALRKSAREQVALLEKQAQAWPDSLDLWCDLGCAYLETGRLFRARDAFRKALEIADDNRRALVHLALTQYELLDHKAARETLSGYFEWFDNDDEALGLWRLCERQIAIREAADREFLKQHPASSPPARGLPDIAIEEATEALRQAGEDVDQMNDREILFLFEARYRNVLPLKTP